MIRFTTVNRDTIEIDLKNGYKVVALSCWKRDEEKYLVTLMIHENTIDMWSLIEKAENLEFKDSDSKSIKFDIAHKVEKMLQDGFFDYYINRCKYYQKCFEKGNTIFEKERLGTSNE